MKTDSINEYLEAFEGTYDDIHELKINKFSIDNEINNVDLNELLNFKNLKKITLCNLIIDDYDLEILSKIENVESISFINVEFIGNSAFINNLSVSELALDNCDVNYNDITNNYRKVIIKNTKVDNRCFFADTLDISFGKVDKDTIDINNFNSVIISNSQFNENEMFKYLIGKKRIIVKHDDYDEVEKVYE